MIFYPGWYLKCPTIIPYLFQIDLFSHIKAYKSDRFLTKSSAYSCTHSSFIPASWRKVFHLWTNTRGGQGVGEGGGILWGSQLLVGLSAVKCEVTSKDSKVNLNQSFAQINNLFSSIDLQWTCTQSRILVVHVSITIHRTVFQFIRIHKQQKRLITASQK